MATAVEVVRSGERLRGPLSPPRRRMLAELREPASAVALAARLGQSRQRLSHHLRELERAGLVELVELRPRRGCPERVVRATARAVMVDPDASGDLQTATQDRFAERLTEQVTDLVAAFDTGRPEHRYRLVAGGHPAAASREEP